MRTPACNAWLCLITAIVMSVPVIFLLALPGAGQQSTTLPVRTLDGSKLFVSYCASCHGVDGKGNGPAAAALKPKVPDLTQITSRSHGQFPRARIRNIIEGTESPVAHGSREMPVWGPVFHQIDADQDLGNVRVDNLASYIESIQRK